MFSWFCSSRPVSVGPFLIFTSTIISVIIILISVIILASVCLMYSFVCTLVCTIVQVSFCSVRHGPLLSGSVASFVIIIIIIGFL